VIEVRRGRRWRVWLPLALSVGIYYGGVQQSAHSLFSHERWNWTDMAVYGGTWAVLWFPAWLLGQAVARRGSNRGWISKTPARRRRDQEERLVKPAIETGTLPPDAEPGVWRPALRGAARELNVLRWVTAVGLTVVASLIGAAAVANDNAWGIWAVAMVVMGEALVAFQLPRRRVRVIRRLLSELS
jgi:hypothetical protein